MWPTFLSTWDRLIKTNYCCSFYLLCDSGYKWHPVIWRVKSGCSFFCHTHLPIFEQFPLSAATAALLNVPFGQFGRLLGLRQLWLLVTPIITMNKIITSTSSAQKLHTFTLGFVMSLGSHCDRSEEEESDQGERLHTWLDQRRLTALINRRTGKLKSKLERGILQIYCLFNSDVKSGFDYGFCSIWCRCALNVVKISV